MEMSLRSLLERLLAGHETPDSGWVNVRSDELPWRHIVAAAERGEVHLSRVGRKLLMRRVDLDEWLGRQRVSPRAEKKEALPAADDLAIQHTLARGGMRKR
jgi:hypothetical protein